jgi:hypothetical protein
MRLLQGSSFASICGKPRSGLLVQDIQSHMSRLDNFISRMTAQRDILNQICPEVAKMEGLVFELGLGNGRTFHHLRERLPGRRIVVFDREVGAHASSIPDAENLVLGDIRETARRFIGIDAALVHADIGTGYEDRDAVTATWLPDLIAGMLRVGGFAVSGTPLDHPQLQRLPAPTSEPADRYFLCKRV